MSWWCLETSIKIWLQTILERVAYPASTASTSQNIFLHIQHTLTSTTIRFQSHSLLYHYRHCLLNIKLFIAITDWNIRLLNNMKYKQCSGLATMNCVVIVLLCWCCCLGSTTAGLLNLPSIDSLASQGTSTYMEHHSNTPQFDRQYDTAPGT